MASVSLAVAAGAVACGLDAPGPDRRRGPADEVYDRPRDPYAGQLLAAVPALDPAVAARRRSERRELARWESATI
ncbi:hypothetical protein ACFXGG_28600 [Streptomyces nigra]|uniref:hypothetical protein n=1 Tax=Streptomyces nigra TaxID=1827580 RepID=UPI00369F9ABF